MTPFAFLLVPLAMAVVAAPAPARLPAATPQEVAAAASQVQRAAAEKARAARLLCERQNRIAARFGAKRAAAGPLPAAPSRCGAPARP